jgi:glucokinase
MGSQSKRADSADLFNVAAMFARVEESGGISRALLARQLGFSRTTASTLASKLLDTGLIAEREGKSEGRGRPGIILEIATDHWFAIGAEFHSGRWVFVLTTLRGEVVESFTKAVPDSRPESFLETLTAGLGEMRKKTPGKLLPAVGIGTPGLVDCSSGTIIRADDLGWKSVAVAATVEKALGMTAYVINRNRGSGLAEARFGGGREVHGLVYIGIGTGISAAFILDGRLIHGSNYSAGEIGHVVMRKDGPTCGCGKRGCLQVLASGSAMAAEAAMRIAAGERSSLEGLAPGSLRGEDVCVAAAGGDKVAMASLETASTYLGLAVANIITTYNPDRVLLGGPVGREEGPFLEMVRGEAARWAMDFPFSTAKIERCSLQDNAGALGAACLVLDRKLNLALDLK